MSLLRHSTLGLGLGLDRMTCAARTADDGQWHVQSTSLPAATNSAPLSNEQIAQALDSLLSQCGGEYKHVRVVLASECLREWVMEVPAGVQSLDELRNLTVARFAQLHAQPADQWMVTADWTTRGPMLCTAAPRHLVETVQSELERRGLRSSLSTTLCSALSDISELPSDTWLCIRTPDFSALLLIRQRSLQLLRILRTSGLARDGQLASLAAEVKRACLRSDLSLPAQMHIYDSSRDPAGQQSVDGIELIPVSSRMLSLMAAAQRDADSTVAACMGAAL